MGLSAPSVKLLLEAKAAGISFKRTLMLGRQFFSCPPVIFTDLARAHGFSEADCAWLDRADTRYADRFFTMLGAEEVLAMDYSDYEGARLVHDINQPIPPELRCQFDAVLDGGTLEHVFHVPNAMKNAMDLVKCGGHLLHITPINNYCGHGFYQFSPELFFRLLSERNGFCVERAVLWEEKPYPRFYEVRDPLAIHERVELVNRHPVLMLVQARKLAQVDQHSIPQQSDYAAIWKSSAGPAASAASPGVRGCQRLKKRMLLWFFTRYPYGSRPLLALQHWWQTRRRSLNQEPGFKARGRLYSWFGPSRDQPS